MKQLITIILGFAGKKLDGKKTLIGGIGLILTAIVGLVSIMLPDAGLPAANIDTVLATFSAGFVAIGLGGKAEKLIAALNKG